MISPTTKMVGRGCCEHLSNHASMTLCLCLTVSASPVLPPTSTFNPYLLSSTLSIVRGYPLMPQARCLTGSLMRAAISENSDSLVNGKVIYRHEGWRFKCGYQSVIRTALEKICDDSGFCHIRRRGYQEVAIQKLAKHNVVRVFLPEYILGNTCWSVVFLEFPIVYLPQACSCAP